MCEKKLVVVCQFFNESGMITDEKKTNFFVINGQDCDRRCLSGDVVSVDYASEYLHHGAWFTDSGKRASAAARHETASEADVSKFPVFSASNTQMPFI